MRKFIAPIALLAFIIVFCTVCVGITDRICTDTADLLVKAESFAAMGDYESAEELTRTSQLLWKSREGFLGIVLRHTESDDVYCMYPPLLECCRDQDQEEFRRKNHELRAYLRQLSRMEIPYFFNVF